AEMVADPQVQAREMFVERDDPKYGRLKLTGTPLKLSRPPGRVRSLAPNPGAHNEDIFVGLLGHSREDLARWQAEGVVRRGDLVSCPAQGGLADRGLAVDQPVTDT